MRTRIELAAQRNLKALTDSMIHATMLLVLHLAGRATFSKGELERALTCLRDFVDVLEASERDSASP